MEIRSREEWGNCRYLKTQMDVEELGTVEITEVIQYIKEDIGCLLYTSPSPRDRQKSRMPSSA